MKHIGIALLGVALAQVAATPVLAGGDPVVGKRLYLQCQACHTTKAGDPQRAGPTLAGIYGAKAGQRPGYKSSAAVEGLGVSWDGASLDKWLTRPNVMAPGNKMAFAGMKDPKARENLIAFLKTLK